VHSTETCLRQLDRLSCGARIFFRFTGCGTKVLD
jgi:hypothetical protein